MPRTFKPPVSMGTRITTLEGLFDRKKEDSLLSLPEYQRPYVWPKATQAKSDNVRRFAKDIITNLSRSKNVTTFLGSMVFLDDLAPNYRGGIRRKEVDVRKLCKDSTVGLIATTEDDAKDTLLRRLDDKPVQVIDGQQRLTTLLISCGVLKCLCLDDSLFSNCTDITKFGNFQRKTIIDNLDRIVFSSKKDKEIRFRIANKDRNQIGEYCSDPAGWKFPPKDDKKRYWPVEQAAKYIHTAWGNFLRGKKKGIKRRTAFSDLYIHLTRELTFVVTSVANKFQAHLVFQSLNSTGELLSLGEVMNSLFLLKSSDFSPTTQEFVADGLGDIEKNIGHSNSIDGDILTDFYVRNWYSFNEYVGKAEIFECYERHVSEMNQTKFKAFITELIRNSEFFGNVLEGKLNGAQNNDLLDMEAIMKQHRPIFISSQAASFDDRDHKKLLKYLTTWLVRYEIAGRKGSRAKVLWTPFSEWSCLIGEHGVDAMDGTTLVDEDGESVKSIKEDLIDLITSVDAHIDSNLIKWLEVASLGEQQAKFLLRRSVQKSLPSAYSTYYWTAEHICPKSHPENWPTKDAWKMSTRHRNQYKGLLGNFLIVTRTFNGKLGNKGWFDKRRMYKDADNDDEPAEVIDFGKEFYKTPVTDRKSWAVDDRRWTPDQIKQRTKEIVAEIPSNFRMLA